ncbi:S-layer protein [Neosynechococcus sphagnicola sy1]|uniref:S-layer protein n=1 Tax=Neosynechococcus sphagnicola sy1 TaxID=1497020 RepID=A0A098TNH1_9CYAN|nr:S-layer protein [Neosynechococcus sphagnicola sy1]
MLISLRAAVLLGLLTGTLATLTACANSPTGQSWERSLAADPRLQNNPSVFGGSPDKPTTLGAAELPRDFPPEIPRYPNAVLVAVKPPVTDPVESTDAAVMTQWTSGDRSDRVMGFYQQAFQSDGWQIEDRPTDDLQGTFVARRNDLQVTISIQPTPLPTPSPTTPSPSSQANTTLTIEYNQGAIARSVPAPGSPDFIGPLPQEPTVATTPLPTDTPGTPVTVAQSFSDLNKAPQELQSAIADLAALGVLTAPTGGGKQNLNTSTLFAPSQPITRREFARWLVAANNQIYANRPAQKVRLGADASQPVFKDVPKTDPDFAAIQGLAEAGLIPSPLTGDSAALLFRPDAPLTRETLILWKVPLDTRQTLPTATIDTVKQTWGFQDTAKIDPRALRAVLADHQNGDLANIHRAFGFTALFQPKKPVTRAEAAATLWYFGYQGEGQSAQDALQLRQSPSPG